jgi:hypothetical protein
MPITEGNRKVAIGVTLCVVLLALLVGAFFLGGSREGIQLLFSGGGKVERPALANPGDTPVVLIGGTVIFKAGAQDNALTWTPVPNGEKPATEYFVAPTYSISTIVLSSITTDDGTDNGVGTDSNPKKDKISVDVSNAANSWQIDEFASANGAADSLVASIFPKLNGSTTELHLKVNGGGILCPKTKYRILYGQVAGCADFKSYTLTKVNLLIDNASGVPTPSGTLSCVDDSSTPSTGKCRIVLRGPPS